MNFVVCGFPIKAFGNDKLQLCLLPENCPGFFDKHPPFNNPGLHVNPHIPPGSFQRRNTQPDKKEVEKDDYDEGKYQPVALQIRLRGVKFPQQMDKMKHQRKTHQTIEYPLVLLQNGRFYNNDEDGEQGEKIRRERNDKVISFNLDASSFPAAGGKGVHFFEEQQGKQGVGQFVLHHVPEFVPFGEHDQPQQQVDSATGSKGDQVFRFDAIGGELVKQRYTVSHCAYQTNNSERELEYQSHNSRQK